MPLLLLLSPLAAQDGEMLPPLPQFEQETRQQISDENLKLFGKVVITVQQNPDLSDRLEALFAN